LIALVAFGVTDTFYPKVPLSIGNAMVELAASPSRNGQY
jgi:hypothetical protein